MSSKTTYAVGIVRRCGGLNIVLIILTFIHSHYLRRKKTISPASPSI